MPLKQLKIITDAVNADALSDLLMEAGAVAVSFEDAKDQPIYEPAQQQTPLWDQTCVCGLFNADADEKKICAFLQEKMAIKNCQFETLPEKNWVEETQKNFPPLHFGKNLWICPSWEKITIPNAIVVYLNPGLAFGTGTHATTALCLEWLEANIKPNDLVIDYGCGSGILGIAAIKLGAKQVWAIDHDPQALEATKANAALNQINESQLITAKPDNPPPWLANILIANILAQPLIDLAEKFATLLVPQGHLVLSGILREQVENVVKAYRYYFRFNPPAFKNEWVRLNGIRQQIT